MSGIYSIYEVHNFSITVEMILSAVLRLAGGTSASVMVDAYTRDNMGYRGDNNEK